MSDGQLITARNEADADLFYWENKRDGAMCKSQRDFFNGKVFIAQKIFDEIKAEIIKRKIVIQ